MGGISILFTVFITYDEFSTYTQESFFVRSTLQISLSSTSDPIRNRVFITSISQVKLLKPHIFILVFNSLKMSLQVVQIHHFFSSESQKNRQKYSRSGTQPEVKPPLSVFMPLRGNNHIFLFRCVHVDYGLISPSF